MDGLIQYPPIRLFDLLINLFDLLLHLDRDASCLWDELDHVTRLTQDVFDVGDVGEIRFAESSCRDGKVPGLLDQFSGASDAFVSGDQLCHNSSGFIQHSFLELEAKYQTDEHENNKDKQGQGHGTRHGRFEGVHAEDEHNP
jgi:hypothetical protein